MALAFAGCADASSTQQAAEGSTTPDSSTYVFDPTADASDGGTEAKPTDLCSESSLTIPNTIPKILVLADGSESMFQPLAPGDPQTHWTAARNAMLALAGAFPVRSFWGLAQYRGLASSDMCLSFTLTPPAIGNASQMASDYLEGPFSDEKLEGPIADILPMVPTYLDGLHGVGKKVVILATAGEPDFCADESTVCPLDAAIAGIRDLASQDIKTIVVGQPSGYNTAACPGALASCANAGDKQPIGVPCPGRNVFAECGSNPEWKRLAVAAGRSGGPSLVDYNATPGTAPVYSYSAADQLALKNVITPLVPNPKSCTFDLAMYPSTTGKPFPFDEPTLMDSLVFDITIGYPTGTDPPHRTYGKGGADGWTQTSRTVFVLHGQSCADWLSFDNETISFRAECLG